MWRKRPNCSQAGRPRADGVVVDSSDFTESLLTLRLIEIRAIASDLESLVESPADEISLTRAVLAIESAVREQACGTFAAVAAQQASDTVVRAAERSGVEMPDMDVARVARAAAQIARGLVVGESVRAHTELLAVGFRGVTPAPA